MFYVCDVDKSWVFTKWLFYFQSDAMMSCPLPMVPVIQPLPALNTQPDFPLHIGIKVSLNIFFLLRPSGLLAVRMVSIIQVSCFFLVELDS